MELKKNEEVLHMIKTMRSLFEKGRQNILDIW